MAREISRFEQGLKETIWEEIKQSDLLDDAIKEGLPDAVNDYVNEIDLSDYISIDSEIKKSVEKKIDEILSSDKIDKIVAERLDISTLIRAVMNTNEFKEILKEEVQKEFDKLWT